MGKRSKLLLASWILGLMYFICILFYLFTKNGSGDSFAENIGYGIATMLVAPHIFLVFLSLIFNIIGWAASKRWAALTGAILYCVAALAFLLYCIFVIPSIILSFVGFAKLASVPGQPHNQAVSNHAPAQEYGERELDLFDRLIPVDSVREKLLPLVLSVLTFAATMAILAVVFV